MSWLDFAALAVVALSALSGFKRGLVVGALSLAGLVIGAIVGSKAAPSILGQADSRYVPLIALGGAVVFSFLAQALFTFAGRRVRLLLMAVPPLKALDHLGGLILGALTGLMLCWVVGAVMLYLPGETGLRERAQASTVLSALNDIAAPATLMETLQRYDPFALVAGPDAGVDPPNPAIVGAAGVTRARASVVRIRGNACGFGVEGSGWVAGPGLLVTNAHVVAGVDDPIIDHGEGSPSVNGTVVAFDPKNDVAVIRASGVVGAPLPLASPVEPGTAGAILGFPGNGPFTSRAARIGRDVTFALRDAYGNFPVLRTTTLIRGVVERGNSGGPVVDARGRVITTVFGTREGASGSGYGVPNGEVARLLADPGTTALSTACSDG